MANRQNGKLPRHFPLSVLVVVLFAAALTTTAGMMGFVLGRNAARPTGEMVDTIVLSPGTEASAGSETVHYLSGRLLHSSGDPFSGATVQLQNTGISDETDGRGKFYLSGVRAGTHRLQVKNSAGETVTDMELSLDFSGGVSAEFGEGYTSLQMPQDVRLLEFTLTMDGNGLNIREDSIYFVTKDGTIVDFGGGALSVKEPAVAILPNVDVVAPGGKVLIPSAGVIITPQGGEDDVPIGAEVLPGITVEEDGTIHIDTSSKPDNGNDSDADSSGGETDSDNSSDNEEPPESNNEEPPESNNEEPPESNNEEPPESNNEEPPESNNEEPPESNNEEPPESNNEEPPESNNEEPPESNSEEPPEGGEAADGDIVITPDGEIILPDDSSGEVGDDVIVVEDGTVETVPELPEEYAPPEDESPEQGEDGVPGDEPAEDRAEELPMDGAAGEADQATTQAGGLDAVDSSTGISWKQQSIIDLFKNRNTFSSDKTADSAPIVAPGSSGYYEFKLENPEDFDIAYTLSFDELSFHLPIRYSVLDGRTNYSYLYRERIDAPGTPLVSGELVIAAHSEQKFRIEWDWMYEDWYDMEKDDATDLSAATQTDRTYILSVMLNAVEIVKEPEESEPDVSYAEGDTRYPGKH